MSFQSPAEQKRYETLITELRCPKCQNQSLNDSNSAIATDLRHEVQRMIESGRTDEEIKDYMVARYGEFVLYRPVFANHTLFLWLAPLVFLCIGLGVFVWISMSNAKKRSEDIEP